MAKAKSKSKSKAVDSWKKKKWHPIVASALFNNTLLGETVAEERETVMGKKITSNLMTLTNDFKRKDTEITFQVIGFDDDKAKTEVTKYAILPSAIKRMVRRNRDRLDESFLAKTQDDRLVRIKAIMLTLNNTKSSVQKTLRTALKKQVVAYLNNTPYEQVLTEIVGKKLQKQLSSALKKVYPLRICEIRQIELATESRKNRNVTTFTEEELAEPQKEEDFEENVDQLAEGMGIAKEEPKAEEPAKEANEAPQEEAEPAQEEEQKE